MPLITGRRSSLPVAKMVLLMAVARVPAGKLCSVGSSRAGLFGNSAAVEAGHLVLALVAADLHTEVLAVHTEGEGLLGEGLQRIEQQTGGNGHAAFVLGFHGHRGAVMVVSRSLAVTVSCLLSISKRKLSRMGSVLLLASTPWRSLELLEQACWIR
jgi:hypothetical protein